jgi:hypothetical protein
VKQISVVSLVDAKSNIITGFSQLHSQTLLLSDEMRDYVQELRRIGVSPLKIQLALQVRSVDLSCGQIHNLRRPACLAAFTDSSAELISWVRDHGGACYSYDERIHDDVARVAVFTQMPDERQVVHEFGDVLEIDGTHAPLKTNWEIIPITLMDCGRHIQCGGIMFAAFVTTKGIAWLLGYSWKYVLPYLTLGKLCHR